jgi:hypothetical protein
MKFPPDRPAGLPKGTALSWNAHKAARFFIILKKKVYNTGEYSHCYMMHTRAVRQMLPYRQPARGAAARSASLK